MAHTNLPWKVDETPEGIQIIDGLGLYVTTIDSIVSPETKAHFIVRACNSHEELLEALKLMVKNFVPPEGDDIPGSTSQMIEDDKTMIYNIALQAIRKAEGKE